MNLWLRSSLKTVIAQERGGHRLSEIAICRIADREHQKEERPEHEKREK